MKRAASFPRRWSGRRRWRPTAGECISGRASRPTWPPAGRPRATASTRPAASAVPNSRPDHMTELTTLVTDRGLVESPRWHDGRLWFADWTAGEILRLGDDGVAEVVA